MKIFLIVIIISGFIACSSFERGESISLTNSETVNSNSKSFTDETGQLAQDKNKLEDFLKFKKIWNLGVLGSFKEPSLEKPVNKIEESYRFIWIPSFDNPVAIRVWRSDKSQFIIVKKTNGQGFEMGKLSYEKTRTMTEEEWINFTNLLNQILFWKMTPIDMNQDPVMDGSLYAIEGYKSSRFHEVHRSTGENEEAKVRELGAYLLGLSELKTKYSEY